MTDNVENEAVVEEKPLRKIEVVEPDGFLDGPVKRNHGDIYMEDPDQAQYFIDLGWAKCVETGECGERKTGVSKIKPNKVTQVMG